jgi:hypothetical protein
LHPLPPYGILARTDLSGVDYTKIGSL